MAQSTDPELDAMSAIVKALHGLDPQVVERVLHWAYQRHGAAPPRSGKPPAGGQKVGGDLEAPGAESFENFHELFDATNPSTAPDKALVAAYWFQVIKGSDAFDSMALNKELKDLGHQSTNITRDLDALIARKPRHVMQTKKEGSTKQARKKYKLTREGIKAVQRMLVKPEADTE